MQQNTATFTETRRNVAGIDIAGHADHYVCGPRKDDGTPDIAHFGTTTAELHRMIAWLKERGVESVTDVRTLLRERENLTAARTQWVQQMQKSCDPMSIRIHHAVSDIDGKAGRDGHASLPEFQIGFGCRSAAPSASWFSDSHCGVIVRLTVLGLETACTIR